MRKAGQVDRLRPGPKWVKADYGAKRQILETVFLNLRLDDISLC
jgi:hypothetical protein